MNSALPAATLALLAAPALAGFAIAPSYEAYFYAGSGPRVNDRLIVNDGINDGVEAVSMLRFDLSSLAAPVSGAFLNLEKYDGGFFTGSSDADPIQIDVYRSVVDVSSVVSDDPNDAGNPLGYSNWLAGDILPASLAQEVVGDDGIYAFDLSAAVNDLLAQNIFSLDIVLRGTQLNENLHNPYFATTLNAAGRLAPVLTERAIPAPGSLGVMGVLGGVAFRRRRRG